MPPLKSFSELELRSKGSETIKLVCSAQCEPLCSLNWFINSRRLLEKTTSVQNPVASPSVITGENVYQPVEMRRFLQLKLDSNSQDFFLQETIGKRQVASNNTDWIYEANILASEISPSDPSALKRESTNYHEGANVFSTLELSYAKIRSLLVGNNDDDLQIKCSPSDQLNLWAFKYQIVAQNEWFPSAQEDTSPNPDPAIQSKFIASKYLTRFVQQQPQTRITLDSEYLTTQQIDAHANFQLLLTNTIRITQRTSARCKAHI